MIKDFVREINLRLNTLNEDVYFRKTSKASDYTLFKLEIFNKSYERVDGQVVIDLRYGDTMKLLGLQDEVIKLMDKWHYANQDTSASVYFVTANDLSNITDKQDWFELRFEFQLRWRDI